MIVAICDDDALFRNQIHEILIEYKRLMRVHLDIIEYESGLALLNSGILFDVIFLDYEMPCINGIETARKLRKCHKNICDIIYITSYPEHVFESFEVRPYRFLVKPISNSSIHTVMNDFIREKKMMSPIVVNVEGEQITVNSEDIIYLEADGKYCNIRTKSNTIHSSKTLSQVLLLLPTHCFFRTHKSFAINFYSVATVKNGIVTLNNGEKAKISRHRVNDFKLAYTNFIKHFIARI